MAAGFVPATVALCAPLEPGAVPDGRRGPAAGITWVARLDVLTAGGPWQGVDLALEIDPAWLDSRQALRDALRASRVAVPGLDAAVLRGAVLRHHDLLAAEGIRVVVVDAFGDVRRGSRRPAPAGWACRNVAWGLWEVRHEPPRGRRPWSWLWPTGSLPAPRRGGLHVLSAADGRGRWGSQVGLWNAWVARHAARITVVPIAALPDLFEGGRCGSLGGSVLRAA
jgi:hypothetical protein